MWRGCVFSAVMALGLAGCGDGLKRAHIVGKLTAKGVPVDNCSVLFFPTGGGTPGQGGLGTTDATGTFTMISSRAGDKGIPPGEYKVTLSRWVGMDGKVLPADALQADYPGCVESIPRKYTEPDMTPLRVTVPDGGGEIKVDMSDSLLVIRPRK